MAHATHPNGAPPSGTDELVSISYNDKAAAIKALQTHFTNKEFPYLDIAKGSSLLLVNSSDSSDNEDTETAAAEYAAATSQRHFQPNGHTTEVTIPAGLPPPPPPVIPNQMQTGSQQQPSPRQPL